MHPPAAKGLAAPAPPLGAPAAPPKQKRKKKGKDSQNMEDRLITAAQLLNHLGPIGPKLPTTETQVRPLTGLSIEQTAQAWHLALSLQPLAL